MRSLLELLAVCISAAVFYAIGRYQSNLQQVIKKLQEREPEPTVTRTNPRFMISNIPDNNKEVGIATPKSPQLLEFEEEQALRTLNASYKVKPE